MVCLAILIELRLVMDEETDRQMDGHRTTAHTALEQLFKQWPQLARLLAYYPTWFRALVVN